MHLIGPLAAGVAGCESGTFDIVLRGTSTPASYYTDFEGLTSPITGTGVALDARGGGIFYVNALVKVTCKSSAGATIREFIAGDAATAVEVRSSSITGTHYQSGAVAAGNPTTVKAWADMWFASAGAVDFKVLYGGAATNLSTVVGALTGQRRYVVTEYGAVGNGIANDLSAINAAISAANTAGGGIVYFPPGTYNISNALTTFVTVSLEGAGPGLSNIRTTNDTAALTGAIPIRVFGLRFSTSSASKTSHVFVSSATLNAKYVFDNCTFEETTVTAGNPPAFNDAAATAHEMFIINCDLTAQYCAVYCGSSCKMSLISSTFRSRAAGGIITAPTTMVFSDGTLRMSGCAIDCSATTSNYVYGINVSTGTGIINGCSFTPPAVTVTQWLQFVASSGCTLVESGNSVRTTLNSYSSNYRPYAINFGGSSPNTCQFGSRVGAKVAPSDSNADPVTAPIAQAGHCSVRVTSTAAHSGNVGISADGLSHTGAQATISVWNDTAGAITFQWGSFINSSATFAVAANSIRTFLLACNEGVGGGNNYAWYIVSDVAGAELGE